MIIYFPTYKVISQYNELNKQIKGLKSKQGMFLKSKSRTIFSECHGANGLAISVSLQKRILSYLNIPTTAKWDDIYKEKVTYSKTLWDAWNKTQSNAILKVNKNLDVESKWERIPTPDELVSGIAKLIQSERSKLEQTVDCLQFEVFNLEYKYKRTLEKQA